MDSGPKRLDRRRAYYVFFTQVIWKLLPASIRTRFPYGAKEANESKGDIRSFWDLRKLVLPPHRS